MSDSGFTFNGPSQQYNPGPGQNALFQLPALNPAIQPTTYASLVDLQNLITQAQQGVAAMGATLINALVDLSVNVIDHTLQTAVAAEWPSDTGDPAPSYVSYSYYTYLGSITSSASTYIRNAYESAMQDVGGNDAIDLLPLVALIDQEVQLINDFVANNLSSLNDSAEQRVAENFEDFLQAANAHLQNIQFVFISQTTPLPDDETSLLSQNDAANSQALFKVNVNKLNVQINQDIQTLQANFANSASQFYSYFLSPALTFRQNVGSQILPIYPGTLGANVDAAVNATNTNLNQALVDQTSRNYFFDNQIVDVLNAILRRDSYRDYVDQLSTISGVPVISQVTAESDTPEALSFFQSYQPPDTSTGATPSFGSSHSELGDILDPNAHPQYLNTSGGTITGDVAVVPGITIGGVNLPDHSHTGNDGTAIISGSNIAENSLSTVVVNQAEVPDTPADFRVEATEIMVLPGGTPVGNIYLSWTGDIGLQFEVQITNVPSQNTT